MPLEHPVLGFGPAGLWGRREDVGIWSRGIWHHQRRCSEELHVLTSPHSKPLAERRQDVPHPPVVPKEGCCKRHRGCNAPCVILPFLPRLRGASSSSSTAGPSWFVGSSLCHKEQSRSVMGPDAALGLCSAATDVKEEEFLLCAVPRGAEAGFGAGIRTRCSCKQWHRASSCPRAVPW